MAQEILQIKITAENREAIKKMQDTIAGLNGVTVAAGKADNQIKKTSATSQNFARVIQDLPFGFMGIQNNLTQLIPGIGAAGLAFSALTSAVMFSQVGLQYWVKGTKDAKDSLSDLASFSKDFAKSAAEETVKTNNLYNAANNLSIAMNRRLDAAKELKRIYPDTFANYTAEDIALGKARNKFDELTTSIYANAKARAASNKIVELESQKLEEQFNIEKVKAYTNKQIADARLKPMRRIDELYRKELVISDRIRVIEKRRDADLAKREKNVKSLNAQIALFTKLGGGETKVQEAAIPETKDVVKKAIFDLKKYRQEMQKQWDESLLGTPEVQTPKEKQQPMTDKSLPTTVAQIDNMITNQRLANMAKIREKQQEDAEYQDQILMKQADMYMSVLSPAIDSMFNSLANGQDVLTGLGDMFVQLTKQIAASLVKAAALAAIIQLIPGMSAASGFGAGAKFGDIFKGLLGFSTGGTVSGPDSGYPVVLHGTEHIVRPDQMNSIISQAAMGALSSVKGMGSFDSGGTSAKVLLRGQDMVLMLQRAGVNLDLRRG